MYCEVCGNQQDATFEGVKLCGKHLEEVKAAREASRVEGRNTFNARGYVMRKVKRANAMRVLHVYDVPEVLLRKIAQIAEAEHSTSRELIIRALSHAFDFKLNVED